MIKQTLGNVIKQEREHQGFTQTGLADRAGISLRYLQEMEAGEKEPRIHIIFALAKALGVTPAELLEEAWQSFKCKGY